MFLEINIEVDDSQQDKSYCLLFWNIGETMKFF